MSPPLFLLGTCSISSVWVITSLGLPPNLWTFGFVPVLSIYYLCDEAKLRKAVTDQIRGPWARILTAAIVALFTILWTSFVCIQFILWKVGVLLVWLFCMVKAFDFEKKLYMTDTCGALAKSLVWSIVTSFTGQAKWMTYKGEWAFCCPYTRTLVVEDIDKYYTLQIKPEEHEDVIPERYQLNYHIGSCDVQCVYSPAAEDSGDASADHSPRASAMASVPEENHPSLTPDAGEPQEKVRADAESASPGISLPEGESSSSKTEPVIIDDYYTLVPCLVNKVEVSLSYGNATLESYTYYDRPSEAVAELKRVFNVQKTDGNVVFSTLNRYNGSSRPQAHASCHEFGELLELVLNQSHKLHEVDLRTTYKCIISGHWILQVFLMVVVAGINWYQLAATPTTLTAILLTTFFIFIQFLIIMGRYVGEEHHKVRACVYFIISRVAPKRMDDWYRCFQLNATYLTYCNESYGHPYLAIQTREICFLGGCTGRLPLTGGIESPKSFHMDDLEPGTRIFDLRNRQVELIVRSREDAVWQVDVHMRSRDNNGSGYSDCYREVFEADRNKATNLVALMKWLEDHNCMGVCKDWPKSSLMYAYTYEELFRKVLLDGTRPMITTFMSPIDITVV